MSNYDDFEFREFTCKSECDTALFTLKGLIEGISIDGVINEDEITELRNWIIINEPLHAYKNIYDVVKKIEEILEDGAVDDEELEDLLWFAEKIGEKGQYYDLVTTCIQTLHGICHGLISDDRLTEKEVLSLHEWIEYNDFLQGTYPYDELHSMIYNILEDGIITPGELNTIKVFLGEFVDCKTSANISQTELDELKSLYSVEGICAKNPNITIDNKTFCFTGKSTVATRDEIHKIISENKGTPKNGVTKNLDYLIVGDDGNPCWAFSCYGRKVEKAVELRKSGQKLTIINEKDFWRVINK